MSSLTGIDFRCYIFLNGRSDGTVVSSRSSTGCSGCSEDGIGS